MIQRASLSPRVTSTRPHSTLPSSVCSTARGEWDGTQLISRDWAATAQVPYSLDPDGSYYSWQWWVTGDEYGTYWASGYEGQMICVVPALDALILRFGHTSADRYPPDLAAWRDRVLAVLAVS